MARCNWQLNRKRPFVERFRETTFSLKKNTFTKPIHINTKHCPLNKTGLRAFYIQDRTYKVGTSPLDLGYKNQEDKETVVRIQLCAKKV